MLLEHLHYHPLGFLTSLNLKSQMGYFLDLGLEGLFRIVALFHCLGFIQECGADRLPCGEAYRRAVQL